MSADWHKKTPRIHTCNVCLNLTDDRSSREAFRKIFNSGRISSMSRSSLRRYNIHSSLSESLGIVMIWWVVRNKNGRCKMFLTWPKYWSAFASFPMSSKSLIRVTYFQISKGPRRGTQERQTSSEVGSCLLIALRSSIDSFWSSNSRRAWRI